MQRIQILSFRIRQAKAFASRVSVLRPMNSQRESKSRRRCLGIQVALWVLGLALALACLALPHPILAQGCPLCYNTASAAGARGIAALRNGILILMIPPVIIFGVVSFFTIRGRNRFNDECDYGHDARI